jgi:type IV pilus assembly protein PilN
MIRINLMPYKRGRVSKKTLDFRNFLMATGAAMAVVVLGGGSLSWIMVGRVHSLQAEKQQMQVQLTQLKAKSAKIATIEQDRKTFAEKIKIIDQLKTRQTRPVMFLDTLAHRLPERVWLTRMEESEGKVTVNGRALTNTDIVEMIQAVKSENFLTDVQLVESRRIRDKELSAYEFTLTGNLVSDEPAADAADAAGAKAAPARGRKS